MAYFSRDTIVGAFSLLVLGCGQDVSQRRESDVPGGAGTSTSSNPSAAAAGANAATGVAGGTIGQSTASIAGSSSTTQLEQSLAGAAGTGTNSVAGAGGASVTASAGVPAAAGATTTPAFDGIPAVGATVPSYTLGGPAGTVRSVTALGGGLSLVAVRYESAWNCPADAIATAQAGTTRTTPSATVGSIELATADCHTLAALRRPGLKAQSQVQLAIQRASLVYAKCQSRSESWCIDATGAKVNASNCYTYDSWSTTPDPPPGNTTDPPSGTTEDPAAAEYSTTNTQVASVDEADYVKNDGNTIYLLGPDGLHVIDAWPAPETHQVAQVAIPGEPRRLFLSDQRLVVYSRIQSISGKGDNRTNPSDQGCTYGYGCRYTSDGGHSLVIVYDVSAPAQPKELIRYEMSGAYVAARRVGSVVYTIVHDAGAPQPPGLDFTLQATSYEELQAAFAARAAANDALIDNQSDAYFVPWIQTTSPDGSTAFASDCGTALMSADARGMSFVSVNAFDLNQLQPPTRTVMGSNPGYVYASPEALYLAVDQVPEPTDPNGYSNYSNSAANSVVHKFALAGTAVSYRGSALLTGHILNQFAMDERQGILRVASTAGWVPDPKVVSYLTTFTGAAGGLKQLGQLGGIAPTEDIRSVRFDDDRGFVVTFKKTDPLFVFDLSDPAAPRTLGELKIPGFSTYMHRLDRDHLLAVGFEADDKGSFAYFNGIQIQIFDVTDLSQPALLHKRVIGTRGSGSEALTNHLAFNYFAPKKMLALPITVCEGGGNGTYGDQLTFAGLMAFDISLESGITEHGRLPFIDPSSIPSGESCSKWWTNSTSLVKRSIFMDNWVYGLSDAQLRVANLASMSETAAVVSLVQ